MPDRLNHPANLLDRFSAALRNNRRAPSPESLDAGLARTARAIERLSEEVSPDSGASERVWQAIESSNGGLGPRHEWAEPPHVLPSNGRIHRIDEWDDAPVISAQVHEAVVPTLARPQRRSREILQLVAELTLLIAGAGLLVLLFRGSGEQTDTTGNAPASMTADARINQRVVADWSVDGSTLGGSVLAGLGIAPDGTLYVADYANSRILHLRSDGSLITAFGGPGSGPGELLLTPDGLPANLGVDSAGNVYVPDYGNSRIQIFAPDGSYLTTWDSTSSSLGLPFAVAVDSEDNVFVADYSASEYRWRILKLDRDGNHLLSIETDDSGDNEIQYLAGIAVDGDDNVYVCDVRANRILKFDGQGRFLLEWGGSGTGPGLFNEPSSITVDRDGTVYVTDEFNFRVQRFDTSGKYLGEWGNMAGATYTLDRPFSIAAGDDGAIYVVDFGNSLHRFHVETP